MSGSLPEGFYELIERIDAGLGSAASRQVTLSRNIGQAIRPVFFQTDHEEFQYATYGGTLFVVEYGSRLYALTCEHVFGDFPRERLFITADKQAQKGCKAAPIKGFYNPSSPTDGAEGADIVDLCVIELAEGLTPSFFGSAVYTINENTVGTAKEGASLLIAGVLEQKSQLVPPDIAMGYCRLQFQDAGAYKPDPFLRKAIAEFDDPKFTSLNGTSGSPVYDIAAERLCGMVLRGGMKGKRAQIFYLDIADIMVCLHAIRHGAVGVKYTKGVSTQVIEAANFLESGYA